MLTETVVLQFTNEGCFTVTSVVNLILQIHNTAYLMYARGAVRAVYAG
jgi:hypothetical protein